MIPLRKRRCPVQSDPPRAPERALARGVVLAPGNVFSIGQGAAGFLRFNVAQCTNPRVFTELSRAMEG